jgi:transmembrane sensor
MSDTNLHREASAAEINDRAANWIESRMRSSWGEADEAALQAWLAEAVAHRIAFWRLESAWSEASRLAALRPTALQRPRYSTPANNWSALSKSLAAAALIAAAGYFASGYFTAQNATYSTGLGERKTLTLADGSQIELNTNTVLRTATSGKARKVWLDKGEAYFSVKHDATHPFEVIAQGRRITDLGTRFNVRADEGQLKVAVLQGRVSFEAKNGGDHIELKPGDVIVAGAGKLSLTRMPTGDLTDRLSWRSGKLMFHHTPLSQVASEFNRYNSIKVVVTGESARDMTINGAFATNDVQAFGRIAQTILGLRVDHQGSKIVISR